MVGADFGLGVQIGAPPAVRKTCRRALEFKLIAWAPSPAPARQDPIGNAGSSRHGKKRAPGPCARQNLPQKISCHPSFHPSEQPPPTTPRPFLALLPLHRPKKGPRRFPIAVWRGCRCRRRGYQRRINRRRPTPPARCSSVCLAGRYGQQRRAHDGGDARG
jgi:hypothetical protein